MDDERWVEIYSSSIGTSPVQIYDSHFRVLLGQYVGIEETLLDAEALYLTVSVRLVDDTTWTALSGRQLLAPSAFAIWSPKGADFDVAGILTVAGDASAHQLVVDPGDSLTHTAVLRVGQFTVDSENDQGLVNLVAGAEPSTTHSNEHTSLGSGRTSRIALEGGEILFYVTDTTFGEGETVQCSVSTSMWPLEAKNGEEAQTPVGASIPPDSAPTTRCSGEIRTSSGEVDALNGTIAGSITAQSSAPSTSWWSSGIRAWPSAPTAGCAIEPETTWPCSPTATPAPTDGESIPWDGKSGAYCCLTLRDL